MCVWLEVIYTIWLPSAALPARVTGYVHISLLAAQELLDTLAFKAPVPVDMLAGRLDEDEGAAAAAAAAVTVGVGGVVVESGSVCWAWAWTATLFVLLFSSLARLRASSRSLASKYQTVMA